MKWYKKLWFKVKVIAKDTYKTCKEFVLVFLTDLKPLLLSELGNIVKEAVKEVNKNKKDLLSGEEARAKAFDLILEKIKEDGEISLENLKESTINLLIEVAVKELKK